MVQRRVFHHLHLLLAVENQRVVVLTHKITFHLPLAFLDFTLLTVFRRLQRKQDTLHLQFFVCRKVEDKVVEQLVSGLWHGDIC